MKRLLIMVCVLLISLRVFSQSQFPPLDPAPKSFNQVKVGKIFWLNTNDTIGVSAPSYPGALIFRQQTGDTAHYYSNGVKWMKIAGAPDFSTLVKYTDTSGMLVPYLRKADTVNLSNRIDAKVGTAQLTDSLNMLNLERVTTTSSTANIMSRDLILDAGSGLGSLRVQTAHATLNRFYSMTTGLGAFRPLLFQSGGVLISNPTGSAFGWDGTSSLQVNGTAAFNGAVSGLNATADNHFVTRQQFTDSLDNYFTKNQLRTPGDAFIDADNTRSYKAISSFSNALSQSKYTNGQIILIGNSIGEGVGASSLANTWFSILQDQYHTITPDSSSEIIVNFGMATRYSLSLTGSWALAGTGPINKAITLQPGAKIAFSGDYDMIDFFVNTSTSSGSLEVRYNTVLKKTVVADAATQLDSCTWTNTPLTGVGNGSWEITCVDDPVTITGLIRVKGQRDNRVLFTRAAISGYGTKNFNNSTLLASMKRIAGGMSDSSYTTYVVSLGANDIYNVANATSPAVMAENMKAIFSSLLTGVDGKIIFVMEPKPDEALYPPILAYSYEQYLERAHQVCDEMGIQFIDMNKVGFLAKNLYDDGQHLNDEGGQVWVYNLLQEVDKTPQPNFSDRKSVSIGTNNPDVYNEGVSSYLTLQAQPGKYGTLNVIGDGASGSGEIVFGRPNTRESAIGSLNGPVLGFYVNPSTTGNSLTERMRILSNGNIGINTTTPTVRMDVNGAIRSRSYFQLSDIGGGAEYYWQAGTGYAEILEGTGSARVRLSGGMVGIHAGAPTSRLHVFGSFATATTTLTGNTTLDETHQTVRVNNTGTVTITLPTASGCSGRIYTIIKISASSNDIIISGASKTLTLQGSALTVQSNGSTWDITSSHAEATVL